MTVLFDTCILLDFLLDREPFADDAEQLLLMIALNDIKGFITVKSLMDIHYVLKNTSLMMKKKSDQHYPYY